MTLQYCVLCAINLSIGNAKNYYLTSSQITNIHRIATFFPLVIIAANYSYDERMPPLSKQLMVMVLR